MQGGIGVFLNVFMKKPPVKEERKVENAERMGVSVLPQAVANAMSLQCRTGLPTCLPNQKPCPTLYPKTTSLRALSATRRSNPVNDYTLFDIFGYYIISKGARHKILIKKRSKRDDATSILLAVELPLPCGAWGALL